MKVIWLLAVRYMRKNKRRTAAAILGIALSVFSLTVVTVFTASFSSVMEQNLIEEEGGWHATYHQVTKEQAGKIADWGKVKKSYPSKACSEHPDSHCVDVEMKHPGITTIDSTQRFAKKIGMEKLPREEWTELAGHAKVRYAVTYHEDLLEFHGVFNQAGEGIGAVSTTVLVMIILFSSVFIYNAFAVSAFEKMRYLGMLGSVGATHFQKSACILLEGVMEGLAGIPAGFVLGLAASAQIIRRAGGYLFAGQEFVMKAGPGECLLILACAVIVVLGACTIPSSRAGNASVMDLLIRTGPERLSGRNITSLKKPHKIMGTKGALALKNIFYNEKQYTVCVALLSLSLIILLDGYVKLQAREGAYSVDDERERPKLAMWTELVTEDGDKINTLYRQAAAMPEIKNISQERVLDFYGILIDKTYVAEEIVNRDRTIEGYGSRKICLEVQDQKGKQTEGCLFSTKIIGLDEDTFHKYAEKAGINVENTGNFPVIVEDYIRTEKESGKGEEYQFQSVLKPLKNGKLPFVYSRYGDLSMLNLAYGTGKEPEELLEGEFQVLGTTQEAPPTPYYSGTTEDINGYKSIEADELKIYMPMSAFDTFIHDPAYKDTYGIHPESPNQTYLEYKPIYTYLKYEIERASDSKNYTEKERRYFHTDLKARSREDEEFKKKAAEAAAQAGFQTASPDMEEEIYEEPPKEDLYFVESVAECELKRLGTADDMMIQIFGYGVILLMAAFSLTSIIQKIATSTRMRRQEFAMLQSLGMTKKDIRHMVTLENSLYGILTGLLGIPFSLFIMHVAFKDNNAMIKIIPWHIIGLEVLLVVIVTLVPVIYGRHQQKGLDIHTVQDYNF